MENLLDAKGIPYERKDLNNNYNGYILYSKSLGELRKYWKEEDLKQYKLYNKCLELKEVNAFRYFYYQELTNNPAHEKLIIIMMNPSLANSTTLDPTIRNINRYLKEKNYSSFEIVNLHHIRTPKSVHLKSYLEKHSDSAYKEILEEYINQNKENCKIVAAWGKNYDSEACNFFKEKYKNFWVFALNKNGSPAHFAAFNTLKTTFNDFKQIKTLTEMDV